MDINTIASHIKESHSNHQYNEFAVLIPLIMIDKKIHILFEKRSYKLRSQPGEICFPGGRKENDETPSYSALRETMEELNISEEHIKILNNLGSFNTPFNYKINMFLGELIDLKIEDINFNKYEVDSLFTIPLEQLLSIKPENYNFSIIIESPYNFPHSKVENGRKYNIRTGNYKVNFYEYNNTIIWGITGRILKIFLNNIKGLSNII